MKLKNSVLTWHLRESIDGELVTEMAKTRIGPTLSLGFKSLLLEAMTCETRAA
jgi:hypothetical protein